MATATVVTKTQQEKRTMIKHTSTLLVALATVFSFSTAHSQGNNVLNQVFGQRDNLNTYYSTMDKSLKGLQEYKAKMTVVHEVAEKMQAKNFFSTTTLNSPISIDETLTLMEEHGITPKLLYVFANSTENGELITLGVRPDTADFSQGIRATLEHFKEESRATVLGVTAVVGYIETRKLKSAQLDKRIFLVDVSADENLANNPGNKRHMHHFGWDLYHQQ